MSVTDRGGGQRERDDRTATRATQDASGFGERPPGVDQVVDEEHGAGVDLAGGRECTLDVGALVGTVGLYLLRRTVLDAVDRLPATALAPMRSLHVVWRSDRNPAPAAMYVAPCAPMAT